MHIMDDNLCEFEGERNKTPHLAKFVVAKRTANGIFNEAETVLRDAFEIYKNDHIYNESEFKSSDYMEEISSNINRIKVIRQILTRDIMKVVFFGRTSNGKSSVINAILGDSILPSGIGHTTSCFISMRGTEENEPYVIVPDSHDKRNINDLKQLARAVSDSKLGPNSNVNVYWPITRCKILEHQVAFIDSPGIDIDYDLDVWIDKFCRDADVFVLVVNSESTLNFSEKKFFHAVNEHISSPNIFILNNRWDASSYESDIDAIKDQHLNRCVDFLTKELECASHEDAIERVYFISAQEALYKKKHMNGNQEEISSQFKNRFEQTPGFKQRFDEFLKFEEKLQFSLYRSAISTKFTSHFSQADSILYTLLKNVDIALKVLNDKKLKLEDDFKILLEQKKRMIAKTFNAFDRFEKEIHETSKTVQNKLYYLLCEDLQNLPDIVKSFKYPFNSEPAFVDIFINELLHFTKEKIKIKIQIHANQVFSYIQKIQNKIKEFTDDLAHNNEDPILLNKIEEEFKIEWYDEFDVALIYSDFKFDINFKFFFNPIGLYKSLSSKFSNTNSEALVNSSMVSSQIEQNPVNTSNLRTRLILQNNSSNMNIQNPIVQKSIDDLSATITTSTCLMMGVTTKIVGYRIMLAVSSIILVVFLTKWMLWTNLAKRDSLLKQFVYFSETRYKGVFEMISHQNRIIVERSLKNYLRDVKGLVESFTSKIDIEIDNIQIEIQNIDKKIDNSLIIRQTCRAIRKKLESFCIEYELNTRKNHENI